MSDKIVLNLGTNYPFAVVQSHHSTTHPIQVHQFVSFASQSRPAIKQKVRVLKTLSDKAVISLKETSESEDGLGLYFEYVPAKFEDVAASFNFETLEKRKGERVDTAVAMASLCIEHEFRPENIGVAPQCCLKYFLGVNFKINRHQDKSTAAQKYMHIINRIFQQENIRRQPSPRLKREEMSTMDSNFKQPTLTVPSKLIIMKKSNTLD